jgi:hypothetical protein
MCLRIFLKVVDVPRVFAAWRQGASAITYRDTILVFGGYNGSYLNDVLVLRL